MMINAIERVEASWTNLAQAIEGIDEGRLSEPGAVGHWSVKDTLAHIAYWDGRAIATVERALSDEPEPADDIDVEATNQDVHAERADWTLAQALDEFHGTHQRLVTALHMVPTLDPSLIEGDTFEHYDEHAVDIRAWRERTGA